MAMNLEDISKGQIQDELPLMTEKAKRDISARKTNLLHSVNQDKARLDILRDLDDTSVLLIQDWAMKFIPRKYRENQTDMVWVTGNFLARDCRHEKRKHK